MNEFAAAIVLAVLDGNSAIGGSQRVAIGGWRTLYAKTVYGWFGASPVTDLARSLVLAAGITPSTEPRPWGDRRRVELDRPSLLHSKQRRRLLGTRATLVEAVVDAEQALARDRLMTPTTDGRVKIRAQPADVVFAQQGTRLDGRQQLLVMLAIDGREDDSRMFAFSIPEGRELHRLIGQALDGPHYFGRGS